MTAYYRALALLVFGFGLTGCGLTEEKETTTQANDQAFLIGEVRSPSQVAVTAPVIDQMWQFKIQTMAPENQLVNPGDLLIAYDTHELQQRLQAKTGELDTKVKLVAKQKLTIEAEAREQALAVDKAQMEAQKAKRRAEITDASVSKVEREKAVIDAQIARNEAKNAESVYALMQRKHRIEEQLSELEIDQLESAITELKADIAKLTVMADSAGVVVYQPDWKGNKRSPGETVHMGNVVMQVPSLKDLQMHIAFRESQAAKLALGKRVTMIFGSENALVVESAISQIGDAFVTNENTASIKTLDVIAAIPVDVMPQLRPGMKGRVTLHD